MAIEFRTLMGSLRRHSEPEPAVSPAELWRSYDALARLLSRAGLERSALLDAVAELDPLARQLKMLWRESQRRNGKSHAGRVTEEALREIAALQYVTRPMGRYLAAEALRTKFWMVLRSIERAQIALRWEQLEGK